MWWFIGNCSEPVLRMPVDMHVVSDHMMKYTHVHVCCIQVYNNTGKCSMVCVYVYMHMLI